MCPSAHSPVVCILTAGTGSRLGPAGIHLNKALLPLGKQAIISRIFAKFPPTTEFVLAVGHKADQVRDYISVAHPQAKVTFCVVDKFQGPGSGPGYSLQACRQHLQRPFFFVSCDTLWDGEFEIESEDDWFAVAKVPSHESNQYCNFQIADERVVGIVDKQQVSGDQFRAFTGLCYIRHYPDFWRSLEDTSLVGGEHQISNGIQALVQSHKPRAVEITWYDTGTEEKYRVLAGKYEDFDFSKPDEAFYRVDTRIIKFFADKKVAERRVLRAGQKGAFPKIVANAGGFFAYSFVPGRTLYEHCSPKIFENFLQWLTTELWQPVSAKKETVQELCTKFYRVKTFERLAALDKKFPGILERSLVVNGQKVPSTTTLLEQIPWGQVVQGVPVIFHGDLQFDNIIYDDAGKTFTLLDWRQDFGGEVSFGDLYYDLAKLSGGLTINYDLIKKALLTYFEDDSGVTIDFAQRYAMPSYRKILENFIIKNGYSLARVRLINALIFLNMSPLHSAPFDRLLHALGNLSLHQLLESGELAKS